MALVSQASGQRGTEGENGAQFSASDTLMIQAESKSEVPMRACVQSRSGGASFAFDQTQIMPQVAGTFSIGTFTPGAYVMRMIVDDVLVKNFTFGI
jgi:hypothetical protein